MKWRIFGQGYKQSTRFSRFLLFKPAASTLQKINPVVASIFVTEGLFIYIHFQLFEENHQNRISRAGEKKKFSNNFVCLCFCFNQLVLCSASYTANEYFIYHFYTIKDFSISFSRVIIVQNFETVTFYVLLLYKPTFSVIFC